MKKILITGGAGFIGSNVAAYYLKKGARVIVLDNFSRAGSRRNLQWLKSLEGDLRIVKADIRGNITTIAMEVNKVDFVLHLAAQVAVTKSLENPREDFEINALGTFNVLEAIRESKNRPIVIYTSTNKVYGDMGRLKIRNLNNRYSYRNLPHGIDESYPLDFYTPYGSSKGAADQYVRDYARIYDLNTVVFRLSCIYGPRQFGVENQGWLAWFVIAAVLNKKITIYGDGRQVRDILYVDDLISAFDLAFSNIDSVKGEIFNVGGGLANTISVWSEFQPLLEKYLGKKVKVKYSDWRPGDQKVYISDTRKIKKVLGWNPKISPEEGIERLCRWVTENNNLFK